MTDAQGIIGEGIGRIVGALASVSHHDGGWNVRVPLLYPSGSGIVVNISGIDDRFRVSDMGLGFSEAYAMDIANGFSRAAKELAGEYGISYDKRRIFISDVGWSKLPGTLKLVANCSQASVILASERANERKAEERADRLYSRLKSIFSNTAKRAQIKGASNTEWTVDALVKIGDHFAAFDAVTAHQTSVVSTATKFRDLALLQESPVRGAAVESKKGMGTLLAVLAQSASVIEDTAPDQQFRQLAEAA